MKKILLFLSIGVIFASCNSGIDNNPITFQIDTKATPLNYNSSVAKLDSVFYPQESILKQNYPNPFNHQTTIQFSIPKEAYVNLVVLDSFKNEVAVLINQILMPGTYETTFSSNELKNGIYYYKIIANEFLETKEMLVAN